MPPLSVGDEELGDLTEGRLVGVTSEVGLVEDADEVDDGLLGGGGLFLGVNELSLGVGEAAVDGPALVLAKSVPSSGGELSLE